MGMGFRAEVGVHLGQGGSSCFSEERQRGRRWWKEGSGVLEGSHENLFPGHLLPQASLVWAKGQTSGIQIPALFLH